MSGKNYDEEPGSTLDRCPQRAERNFPCKPKTFQLRWLGGGGRKRGCKSEQDGGKGYPASWGLGASLSYSVEGERLGGGRTLSPVPASWVSKAPLGSSLAFQLQTLRMRPALGPRRGQGLTLWLFTPPPPAEGKGKGEGWGAVTTRGIAEVNGLF